MTAPDQESTHGARADWSDEYLRKRVSEFQQWFIHTDLGGGIQARSTAWPDQPERSIHAGIYKYEFIVRRNLPSLNGLRVLDLGCNNGTMALHMARQGAREVVGIDYSGHWPEWQAQAEFVKGALEWRCNTTYNVRFLELDMSELADHPELGTFDVVTAFNSYYYVPETQIADLTRYIGTISEIFLVQCNTRDQTDLGPIPKPPYMKQLLANNGFRDVSVDWPWDQPRLGFIPQKYHRPVVVGRK